MRLLTLVSLILLLFAQPLSAQEGASPSAAEVWRSLVDRGEARDLFGLPRETHWRPEGQISIGMMSDHISLGPDVVGTVELFREATGFQLDAFFPTPFPDRLDETSVYDVAILIGPREELTVMGLEAGINPIMAQQFELSYWPFMFQFQREDDGSVTGLVFLAEDEPQRALQASLVLVLVWTIGGVTLGPELEGLIDASGEVAALTPLGEAVFALFAHPNLTSGMTLDAALAEIE